MLRSASEAEAKSEDARTNLEGGYKLRESHEEEIQVEEELELFVEYNRQEREDVVLLVSHNVGRKSLLQLLCK